MAVWTVLFIEFWKREQSKLQFEWDTTDFEKKIENIRPEFELKVPVKRKNPVTGVSFSNQIELNLFNGASFLFFVFYSYSSIVLIHLILEL
jgi:hypothetical protein